MAPWLLGLSACRPPEESPDASDPGDHSATTAPEPVCPAFGPGRAVGAVTADEPNEISGLVWWDGVLWAVDDGKDVLWPLAETGGLHPPVALDGAVDVFDAEDLARVGDQLVIADVGDNLSVRPSVELLAFDRPPIDGSVTDWPPTTRTTVTWPEGPRNCETMLADPVSGDVLLVEKATDGVSSVIRVPTPLPASAAGEEVAVLRFGEGDLDGPTLTTGGAVAPDGSAVVIRTYLDAWVWPRRPGEPWAATFARTPCAIDLLTERQGEAITWGDGGLYTASEGLHPTVLFYPEQ